jgi:crotonobetainyl-CoA:carnitine CoA-transferase CaiB-like acyl-CoA transferase
MTSPREILAGVKVLDLTRVLAGPWCTQALADMGATVYKIERPGVGDEMRQSPPFLKTPQGESTRDTPSYLCVNRGKRSLTIDFTKDAGRRLLLDLAARCDVLAENFKVGDLKRHGLDYEASTRASSTARSPATARTARSPPGPATTRCCRPCPAS